jgi:hypothetical protein
MTTDTFIQLNQSRIQNVDGCLTDNANVTILQPDGRLAFYYFENGVLTHSKPKVQGW